MNKKIAQIIAVLSVAVGIMVIVGWLLDITVLTSIMPQWIRMKIATATCFVFSGATVFVLAMENERIREIKQVILVVFSMLIVLIMGTLFLGSIFGFQSGMENFAFVDIHETVTPIFQGRPAVPTMIDFLLISVIGLMYVVKGFSKVSFNLIGSIIGVIGAIGIIGYILNIPLLYYEIPGFSNAIAVHTTALFVLLGLAILLISKHKQKPSPQKI